MQRNSLIVLLYFFLTQVNREWKLSSVRTRILKKRPNQFDEVDEAFVASIVDFIKEEEKQLKRDALTCFFYLLAAIFKPEEAQGLKVQVSGFYRVFQQVNAN